MEVHRIKAKLVAGVSRTGGRTGCSYVLEEFGLFDRVVSVWGAGMFIEGWGSSSISLCRSFLYCQSFRLIRCFSTSSLRLQKDSTLCL